MRSYLYILLATWITTALPAIASTNSKTGVYRTAITLTNGTQEIIPDTVAQRFSYTQTTDGAKTNYLLNIIKNGEIATSIPTDSIVELNYAEMSYYEQFAGDWYLVASPNGEANELGIMITEVVSIPFHAVLPSPNSDDYGKYIYCHIDSMPHRKGLHYEADFKLRYAYDEATHQGAIAMILDDTEPMSTMQYAGDTGSYAYLDSQHTYYFGVSAQHEGGDTGNRYMYFVSQNIDTQILEGMELTAQWTDADQLNLDHEYQFPKNYHIYWIVALDIPFSYVEQDAVGIVDTFASPRLMRQPWTKSLHEE